MKGFFVYMSLEIQNDLHKLRRCLDMFEAMTKIEFQTEDGQKFKITLNESLVEVIKPEMANVGNKLKSKI